MHRTANGHRTAMPHAAFRAFVTVVAVLYIPGTRAEKSFVTDA